MRKIFNKVVLEYFLLLISTIILIIDLICYIWVEKFKYYSELYGILQNVLPSQFVWQVAIVLGIFTIILRYLHYIEYILTDYKKELIGSIIGLLIISFLALGLEITISIFMWILFILEIILVSLFVYYVWHKIIEICINIWETTNKFLVNVKNKILDFWVSKVKKISKTKENKSKSTNLRENCDDIPRIIDDKEDDWAQNFNSVKEVLIDYVKDGDIYSIVLSGGYGSGKTTLLKNMIEDMKKDKQYKFVLINVWEYNDMNALIKGLANTISDEMNDLYIKALLDMWSNEMMIQLNTSIISLPLKMFAKLTTLKFVKKIYNRLEKLNKTLVLIIDDVDRVLDKDELNGIFKIYQWFNPTWINSYKMRKRVKIIYSMDMQHVESVLGNKSDSPENENGKEGFLGKILGIQLTTPRINWQKINRKIGSDINNILDLFVLVCNSPLNKLTYRTFIEDISFRQIGKILCLFNKFKEKEITVWPIDVLYYYYFIVKYPELEMNVKRLQKQYRPLIVDEVKDIFLNTVGDNKKDIERIEYLFGDKREEVSQNNMKLLRNVSFWKTRVLQAFLDYSIDKKDKSDKDIIEDGFKENKFGYYFMNALTRQLYNRKMIKEIYDKYIEGEVEIIDKFKEWIGKIIEKNSNIVSEIDLFYWLFNNIVKIKSDDVKSNNGSDCKRNIYIEELEGTNITDVVLNLFILCYYIENLCTKIEKIPKEKFDNVRIEIWGILNKLMSSKNKKYYKTKQYLSTLLKIRFSVFDNIEPVFPAILLPYIYKDKDNKDEVYNELLKIFKKIYGIEFLEHIVERNISKNMFIIPKKEYLFNLGEQYDPNGDLAKFINDIINKDGSIYVVDMAGNYNVDTINIIQYQILYSKIKHNNKKIKKVDILYYNNSPDKLDLIKLYYRKDIHMPDGSVVSFNLLTEGRFYLKIVYTLLESGIVNTNMRYFYDKIINIVNILIDKYEFLDLQENVYKIGNEISKQEIDRNKVINLMLELRRSIEKELSKPESFNF